MRGVDDKALRVAARELLRAARAEFPIIALAAHACDEDRGKILVEVAIGQDGPDVTTVLFDRGGSQQTILLQIEK
jgi:hypothetical protein